MLFAVLENDNKSCSRCMFLQFAFFFFFFPSFSSLYFKFRRSYFLEVVEISLLHWGIKLFHQAPIGSAIISDDFPFSNRSLSLHTFLINLGLPCWYACPDTSGTVTKVGGNFKERLRELGGLDAVFDVAQNCHSVMEVWACLFIWIFYMLCDDTIAWMMIQYCWRMRTLKALIVVRSILDFYFIKVRCTSNLWW